MARINYIGDAGENLEISVGPEMPDVMIGRHRTCGIRTANQSVSRQHARLFFDGETYWLQDNGSSNGTFYQNERLEPNVPIQVADDEFLMCGNFEMRFNLDAEDHERAAAGYDYGEEAPPDDAPAEDVEATRFADAAQWGHGAPPPPPPAPFAPPPPPPPPPAAAAPPPPPPPPPPAAAAPPPPPPPPPPVAAAAPPPPPPPPPPPAAAAPPPPPPPPAAAPPAPPAPPPVAPAPPPPPPVAATPPPPPAPPVAVAPPPPPKAAPAPPPPPPASSPAPAVVAAPARDDAAVAELRAALAEGAQDLEERDQKIGELRIELESLSRRLGDLPDDAQLADWQAELELLRPLPEHIASLEVEIDELRAALDQRDGLIIDLQAQLGEALDAAQAAQAALAVPAPPAPAPAAAAADDAHVAALQADVAAARRSLSEAHEAFEEARAGRRNAEELAGLQRSRADQAEAAAVALRADIERLRSEASVAAQGGAAHSALEATVAELKANLQAAQQERATADTRAQLAQAHIKRLESEGAADLASAKAEVAARQSALEAAQAQVAKTQREAEDLAAQLSSTQDELAAAQATGGQDQASAELEEQLAQLRAQLKVEKAQVVEVKEELARAQAQVLGLTQACEAAQSGAAALKGEVDKLAATNRELESSASANMKRIQKLMKDMEESRAGAGAAESAGLAAARAQIGQLQADLASIQAAQQQTEAELQAAVARAYAAEQHPAAAPAAEHHGAVIALVQELNGVVSTFRNDFMTVSDAAEQVASEDATERSEGLDLLRDGIDACTARSGELKNIVRDLKVAVLGEDAA